MEVKKYSIEYKEDWDNFVSNSKNGTFLFYRDFIEYHADRFTDCSLMFFKENELIALLPGNIADKVFYSHQGLSYGGFILSPTIKTIEVIEWMNSLISYLKEKDINKILYKPVPHIYHRYPAEEDLYALFLNKATLFSRSIASTIDLGNPIAFDTIRKKQVRRAINKGYTISETNSFVNFWNILEENLSERHQARPVHSLQEIEYLKSKFPQQIRLFTVSKENETIGGCVIFETDNVAHVQYISANMEGKKNGALDMLFSDLITEVFKDKKYFDFGTSTEDNGRYLNEGLIFQKEGFGARGTVYDVYTLTF